MSDSKPGTEIGRWRGKSELVLAALVTALGVVVLAGTASVRTAGPGLGPGPRFFPWLVGGTLVVVGVLYVVDVLRGGHGDPEHSEDLDESDVAERNTDWRAVALVSGVFLAFAAFIQPIGWVIGATLLFFGVAAALGARPWLRVLAIAVVLGFATYLLFARGLGVPLPNGPLEGVL